MNSGKPLDPKSPNVSRVQTARLMNPLDANAYGSIHGGVMMRMIDETAGMAAMRHCEGNAVTASIDRLNFLGPSYVGEFVHLKATVNQAFKTSMEVGVRVEVENVLTQTCRHVASAYLTFVAMDDHGRPRTVPPLQSESETDLRRAREAEERRRQRLDRSC